MSRSRYNCFRRCLIILLILRMPMQAGAQTGFSADMTYVLQHTLDSMRTLYNVKGISAAAYIPGTGMWKGVTGESYAGVPLDTTMLMSIGSVTKTFIAAEILKLVESGAFSLEDTIGSLLPPMPNVNGAVKVRQLLSHNSGLGEYLNSSWSAAMNADPTQLWYFPTALAAFLTPPVGAPGSPFNYRNTNYTLLGMIIEAKTGDSLHRVLRNNFLTPLHLGNTYTEVFEHYPNTIAHNWSTATLNPALAVDASGTPHEALWSSTEPAGCFFSDPADLAMWAYKLYGGHVLSPASLTQMLTMGPASGGFFNGYGLGAMHIPADGRAYYGHGGNFFGYAASMIYYPQDSISIAVLINQDCIGTYEARMLMNALIKTLATGIKETAQNNIITIAPNPANTNLGVQIPGNTGDARITISDVTGKVVYETCVRGNQADINTGSVATGDYFIAISTNAGTETRQIAIQH